MSRLLVATPDPTLLTRLLTDARGEGVEADGVTTGRQALADVAAQAYDLAIVDDRLPDAALIELVPQVSALRTGVIALTTDRDEPQTLLLIELGADDVVARPCTQAELRARIHAVLRRRVPAPRHSSEVLVIGPLCVDVSTREVRVRGARLPLPPLEFAVLLALQRRDGAPVSRGVLMEECWSGPAGRRPQHVDAVLRRLRQRLEVDPARPRHLITVRSKGYALRP